MQFSIASIAAIVAIAQAENVAVLLNNDIKEHLSDYLSVVQELTDDSASGLLSLYAAGQTYTDDSYTTLVDSDEYASLSAFASQLPWYGERLESAMDSAISEVASDEATSAPITSTRSDDHSSHDHDDDHSSHDHDDDHSSSDSHDDDDHESSSSSTGGANAVVPCAMAGAFLGALALL